MRLALVSAEADPGLAGAAQLGQAVHVRALALALGRAGHDVTVWTVCGPDRPVGRVPLGPGVVLERVDVGPGAQLLRAMPHLGHELAQRWAAEPPDVVHAQGWLSGLAALVARRVRGVPVVATFHGISTVVSRLGGERSAASGQRERLERAIAHDADYVVAGSVEDLRELTHLGADRRAASVVPCGVDLDTFADVGPTAVRSTQVRVLAVGTLSPLGGLDSVIRALPAVPGAELLVAGGPATAESGDDEDTRRLLALAQRSGVQQRLRLLGRVPHEEMPALLRSADVVVDAAWQASFGRAALEAMACRRPVVASAVGAHIDTVADGVTGLLVPPRRPDRMAAALRTVLADEFRRESYGEAGIDRARSRYGWDRIAGETAMAYGRLLGTAAAGVPEPGQEDAPGDQPGAAVVDLRAPAHPLEIPPARSADAAGQGAHADLG